MENDESIMDREWHNQILLDIDRKKKLIQKDNSESTQDQMRMLGNIALNENLFYPALIAFKTINDKKKVKEIGKKCLLENRLYDAEDAFEFVNDNNRLLRTIRKADVVEGYCVDEAVLSYIGDDIIGKIYDGFHKWAREKGFKKQLNTFHLGKISKLAYYIAKDYDLGIGISKGGLYPTYVFNLFGLETKIIDYHRNKSTRCRWIDTIEKDELKDKKILVIDNDVVTGKTSGAVLDELQKYAPQKVDIALVHDPVYIKDGLGTMHNNITKGYGHVHYQKLYGYMQLDKIKQILQQKMGVI